MDPHEPLLQFSIPTNPATWTPHKTSHMDPLLAHGAEDVAGGEALNGSTESLLVAARVRKLMLL